MKFPPAPHIATACALLAAPAAHAAIIIGNTTLDTGNSPGTATVSNPHTVAANSNRLLVVTVAGEAGELSANPISAITYGTQSLMRAVTNTTGITGGNKEFSEVWYLLAPDIGSFTVSVGSASNGGDGYDVMVMDFANIAQQAPVSMAGGASETHATGFTMNFDLSSVTGQALLIGAGEKNQTGTAPTPTTGTSVYTYTSFDNQTGGGYSTVAGGANPESWVWSWSDNDYAISGAAFAEAVPEPSTALLLLGATGFLFVRRR